LALRKQNQQNCSKQTKQTKVQNMNPSLSILNDPKKRRQTISKFVDEQSSAWIACAFERTGPPNFPGPEMEELYLEIKRLQHRFYIMWAHRTRETWPVHYADTRSKMPTVDEVLAAQAAEVAQ
jgi:hypothetical protein